MHRHFITTVRGYAAAAAMMALACGPAASAGETGKSATDTPPASGRYSMAPVDGGFLRMDTDTGTVSLCAKKASGWNCETVPDDYKAMQQENEALKRELSALRREGAGPGTSAKSERKLELPSEEDIDKAISQVDKYLRKFKGLIEKYQGPDAPGRT
jgi:hypothetical protein